MAVNQVEEKLESTSHLASAFLELCGVGFQIVLRLQGRNGGSVLMQRRQHPINKRHLVVFAKNGIARVQMFELEMVYPFFTGFPSR